jgi:hypothetical protein
MIWVILCLNLLTIAVAVKKRMLLYAILNGVFVYLVTGQAFQIQADLERRHTVYYLMNFINGAGFELALWYVLGISIVVLLLAMFSRGYRRCSRPEELYSFKPGARFYFLFFLFLCVLSFLLIFVLIGLTEFLESGRPGIQTGSTIFLVLLFVGVIPLLLKVICREKIAKGDLACCLLSFLIIGALSRTQLIFCLITIFFALYHSRGWIDARLSTWAIVRLVAFAVIVFVLVVGIGALHDAQNFTHGSLGDLIGYILKNPERSVLSVEYNYRIGVEGMSGTAGALSHYLSDPYRVHFDYGSSWILKGATQWLPGFLKGFASPIVDLSDSLNWHKDSIVAPGIESFFVDFGWFAIVLYPLALYWIGWKLPLKIVTTPMSPKRKVVFYTAAGWTIMFVHGNLAVWIAFTLSYSAIGFLFWPIFRRHIRSRTPISSDGAPGHVEPGLA